MNSPVYLLSRAATRVNYNIGKFLKETGLGKLKANAHNIDIQPWTELAADSRTI